MSKVEGWLEGVSMRSAGGGYFNNNKKYANLKYKKTLKISKYLIQHFILIT
jgi:hypothetical protein